MAVRDAIPLTFLAAGTAFTATGTTAGTAIINLKGLASLIAELNVSAEPAGTPTLDVYIQTSADLGVTWTDIVHYAQVTTSNSVQYAQVVEDVQPQTILGGGTPAATVAGPFVQQDAALPANTTRQGPWGDQLRAKVVVGGTITSGQYTLSLLGFVK